MSTRLSNASELYYATDNADRVYALDGDDTVFGKDGNDSLHGDRGNDELKGQLGDDHLFGDKGNDTIYGHQGDDTIEGNTGDDVIYGGAHDDQIAPGPGADTIVAGAGNDDELSYKYSSSSVAIDLASGLASGGYAENDVFDKDPQGNPVEAPENVRGSFHNDVLGGDGRDNELFGLYGDDLLNGNGGDDVIHPFDGDDVVIGGQGEDTVSYADAVGGVTASLVNGGTGGYAAGDTYTKDVLGNDVDAPENLTGSTNNDTLYGDDEGNVLRGLDGNDFVYGGGGADLLNGGLGDDTLRGEGGQDSLVYAGGRAVMDGGAGYDHVYFDQAPNEAVWVDLSYQGNNQAFTRDGSRSDVDSGDWQAIADLSNIEDITGTRFDDELSGNRRPNTIYSGDGDDVVDGAGGRDALVYGGGRDTMDGGAGQDHVHFNNAPNEAVWVDLSYQGNSQAFTRDGSQSDVDSGNWNAIAELRNVEEITGTRFDDDLRGDGAANTLYGVEGDDIIEGAGGNDRLVAGDGQDTVDGGPGTDELTFAYQDEAVWAHLDYSGNSQAFTRDGSKTDVDSGNWHATAQVDNVEELEGSAYDDDLRGDSGDNVITGRDGDDIVEGAGGQDTLVYTHDSGRDQMKGGAGQDTASFADAGEAVWVHLDYQGNNQAFTRDASQFGVDQGNWEGIASISGVEDLKGSRYDDDLSGDSGANTLHGGEGDDLLAGADGADTFVFEPGTGQDQITDWQDGTDELDLSAFGFSGFAAVDSKASETNGNLEIDLGGGDEVEVVGLSKSDFDAGDVVV